METSTSSSPVCNQVDGGGVSIDYPHFSPPGASIPTSLSEPLLPLPVITPDQGLSHPLPVYTGQPRPEQFSTSLSALPTSRTVSSSPGTMSSDQVLHSAEHLGYSAAVRASNPGTNTARVQQLESLCRDLKKEKNVMEEQFGQQRKKFMNLMVQKDEELNAVQKSVEKFSNEIKQLRQQLKLKDEEILSTKEATKVKEAENREAFDVDRIKYEEEIASLRRIINVERSEREGLGGDLLGNPLASQQRSPSPGEPSLESEMAKAVQESRMLKAVVVPLEEEIDNLRLQLDEARGRLQRIEQTTPPLIDLDTPLPSDMSNAISGSVSPTSTGDGKFQQQLELERSARHDLEMHTKTLEQQKAVLQEEVAALKKNVDDMNVKLAVEQESNQQLKQTWEMANQHFIVAQDQLRQQMYFMQQKQQLLQPPQPSSRGSSPHSPTVVATGEATPLPSSADYPIRRSVSLGELREREGGSRLETQAFESQLKRVMRQLEQRSAMCESYEAQLQRVQEQMLEELDGKDQELSRLREECSKARAGVMRERKAKEELRSKMEEAREHFKIQVEGFQKSMQQQQAKLKALKEQYTQTKHEAQRDLAKFSDERVSLYAHITSAQEEYDCLKVLQAEEAQKFAQHISEEKKERKMVERSLEDLRLRLTELQQEKVAVEDSFGLQLTQLNERLLAEQRDKDNLGRQLEEAKNEITALELVKAELGQEQQMKEEAMAARTVVEDKSRQFIEEQQQKLEREVAGRQAAEQRVREMQKQISSLRSQLDTSQENQRDFVQLCQDLQIKLAKIEEDRKCSSPSHPP